jgi:hypothetical protein
MENGVYFENGVFFTQTSTARSRANVDADGNVQTVNTAATNIGECLFGD